MCKYYKNRKCTNSVGLQSCSLFSEECVCFKDYIEAIEFERKKRDAKIRNPILILHHPKKYNSHLNPSSIKSE